MASIRDGPAHTQTLTIIRTIQMPPTDRRRLLLPSLQSLLLRLPWQHRWPLSTVCWRSALFVKRLELQASLSVLEVGPQIVPGRLSVLEAVTQFAIGDSLLIRLPLRHGLFRALMRCRLVLLGLAGQVPPAALMSAMNSSTPSGPLRAQRLWPI